MTMLPTLLAVSFGRALRTLIEEVRRTPTALLVIMVLIVAAGTVLALLGR